MINIEQLMADENITTVDLMIEAYNYYNKCSAQELHDSYFQACRFELDAQTAGERWESRMVRDIINDIVSRRGGWG